MMLRDTLQPLIFALTLAPTTAFAGDTNPYRHIANEVGNCIFSTSALPSDQEASYTDVRAEFKDAEMIHARCYFAKKKRDFESKGKVYNSMRDERLMYTRLYAGEYNPDHQYEFPAVQNISDASRDWETARFDLDHETCDWKSGSDRDSTNGCVDVSKFVRSVAKAQSAKLPYTGRVCIDVYYKFADTTRRVFDDSRSAMVEQPVKMEQNLATSCFKYTVR